MKNSDLSTDLEMGPNELVDLMARFTDTYKNFPSDDRDLREAACMDIQWRGIVQQIQKGDLFAGRTKQLPIGIRPQSDEGALGYYLSTQAAASLLQSEDLSPGNKEKLEELIRYWEIENTVAKTKKAYPPGLAEVLPSDNYTGESGIAFTLWRMSGIQLDYRKLVTLGIPGLQAEILSAMNGFPILSSEYKLYKAMLQSLDTFTGVCRYYASQARELAKSTGEV
ncbi:MAG: pyruvate formate lyase family protein [Bacteroidales bacterium]